VVAESGTRFEYNNGNYNVLQLLIEDVTGKPFAEYMQETLFKPLGMPNTSYKWTPELQAAVATPYNPNGEVWAHYQGVGQGSGGAYTTASDLARFVAAAMPETKGASAGRGVLKPETVRQMIVPADNTNGDYGFGYKMFPVSKEVRLISHDGANEGWRAMFLMDPEKGDGIVILTNSDIGGKIMGPIVCAWSERTTIDMSPLCKSVSR
jgi:CubicO group peptidase (beta-lactamase class C family)